MEPVDWVFAEGLGLYRNSRALVLTVSSYEGTAFTRLPKAEGDGVAVQAALEEHGFDVRRIHDADYRKLDDELRRFMLGGDVDAQDRLLVYFAGHGHTLVTDEGLHNGYLLPSDALEPDDPNFLLNVLPLDSIHQWAVQTRAKHALFVFDSCFSGQILESPLTRGSSPPPFIRENARRPVRQFITSGDANERVPDESVFRAEFIRALEGDADPENLSFFTASQLARYLANRVYTLTDGRQNPQYGKVRVPELSKGDFVFRLPARRLAARTSIPQPPSDRPDFTHLMEAAKLAEPNVRDGRQRWEQRLRHMEEDFSKASAFEDSDTTLGLKISCWRNFLAAYQEENPFASRDRELRDAARRRLAALEGDEEQLESRAARRSGEAREETPLKIRFRSISPGSFLMGSPEGEDGRNVDERQHRVSLTRPYWVSETVVTQGQWRRLMDHDPSHFHDEDGECPVERVNWFSAAAFANRLSEVSGLQPCYQLIGCTRSSTGLIVHSERVHWRGPDCGGYRLPTEAEWEYAARAGRSTAFVFGEVLTMDQANFAGNELGSGADAPRAQQRTVPVRSYRPNPWGLYDVHGNVGEWVWDLYKEYPAGAVVDPGGEEAAVDASTSESRRVIRGGGWLDDVAGCRLADRLPATPGYVDSSVGFRLVRSSGRGIDEQG